MTFRRFIAHPLAVLVLVLGLALFTATPTPAGAEQAGAPGNLGRTRAGHIDAGAGHTCAILDNGGVRCWGLGTNGRLGFNGTGTIGDNETPGSFDFDPFTAGNNPIYLGANRTATAIAAGTAHTCAILDNGSVLCWGSGGSGRLGYGNVSDIGDNETPGSVVSVSLGAGRTATAITAGDQHTCAILDNGSVRCWGEGSLGRLGYANTNDIGDNELPSTVGTVNVGANRTATAISAGGEHTCAILDNAKVRCWGYGFEGRLGGANTNDIGDDETPSAAPTLDLGVNRTATAIAAGDDHTCARLDDGSVLCWGDGLDGQLGYANTNDIGDGETPGSVGPVDVGAGHTVTDIAAGNDYTCAVRDDLKAMCWGSGASGRLGYANVVTIGDTETPASAGTVDVSGFDVKAVTLGFDHTCAAIVTGRVRCWGSGGSGHLGYANAITIGDNEAPSTAGPVDLAGGRVVP